MAKFAQYAMAATEEALQDADWKPEPFEQREATVRSIPRRPDVRVLTFSWKRVSVLALASATLMKCTTQWLHMRKGWAITRPLSWGRFC